MADPVANPLTLVMTIKSAEDYRQLKALVEGLQQQPREKSPVAAALTKIGTVHFARFVFLSDRQMAVITSYDGDFAEYIDGFVNQIGQVFDGILAHIQDAPPLPVSDHRTEFLAYVQENDLKCVGNFYSAYPDLRVQDILTLQRNHAGGT